MTTPVRIIGTACILALSLGLLAGCKEEVAEAVAPAEITETSLGHFCQMNLLEHEGPKAQVLLEGVPGGGALFFSQVRDAIAYMRGPEQMAPILAVFVNDMGAPGATWKNPGAGNWIAAETAFYVVDSPRPGAMGVPETIPFATREAALRFAAAQGGHVLTLAEITDDMVLAPVDDGPSAGTGEDDDDYESRLRALSPPAGG